MSDGRLLKPTRPVMSLDSTFIYRSFGTAGPNGQLWAAYTEVSALKNFTMIYFHAHIHVCVGWPIHLVLCSIWNNVITIHHASR